MNRLLILISAFQFFSVSAFSQVEDPAPEPTSAPLRIVALAGGPHPSALIQSLNPATGTAFIAYLDADGNRVDSGNTVARFTPTTPDESGAYPQPDDATLAAAIVAPEPAPPASAPLETVLARLTDTELAALLDSADIRVRRFLELAKIRGTIRADSPDLTAAAQLLDALGIVAADRWPTLLGP